MNTANFLRGRELAHLSSNNVKPAWMKNPPIVLDLTNKAFKLYYDAWQGLSKASLSMQAKIGADLLDAADTGVGYGLYPGDLEGVFDHLCSNNGSWTSDYGSNYCGPQISGAINLPIGVVNFLNAVDKRGETLQANYVDYTKCVARLIEAKKDNRWKEVGEYAAALEKTLWYGVPTLWITSLNASASLTSYHTRFTKWNDGFGTVYSFLKTYNDYNLGVGTSKIEAAAIATMTTLIKKFVPVLGDAYAQAFEALPGVIKWARGIREEQDRQIRAILGPGNW